MSDIITNISIDKVPKNKYPKSNVIEYNYNYTPKTTFIINYFTSLNTMLKTINNVRLLGDEVEIVVINDRFGENTPEILEHLQHRNDRMVISRDLGEKRGYQHGARISNATDYLIFSQDDDLAPDNKQWYLDCLKEFESDPQLGMIGMLKGGFFYSLDKSCVKFDDQYEKIYVSWLATGPLMIRRDVYEKIGGWSPEYSEIGEADGGADADIATKVVLAGYKTMLLRTDAIKEWKRRYQRGDGLTNELFLKQKKNASWGKNSIERLTLNYEIYYEKFKNNWKLIDKIVTKHNSEIELVKQKKIKKINNNK